MQINPAPLDDEAAAIVAAYEVLWPKRSVVAAAPRLVSPAWRFSGRWWHAATVVRRTR